MFGERIHYYPNRPEELVLAGMPVTNKNGNASNFGEQKDPERMLITPRLGKDVEIGLTKGVYSGKIKLSRRSKKVVADCANDVLQDYKDLYEDDLGSQEIAEKLYPHLAHRALVYVGDTLIPNTRDNDLRLLTFVDNVFNTQLRQGLLDRFAYRNTWLQDVSISPDGKFEDQDCASSVSELNKRRYYLEAALILARELISPSIRVGRNQWFIPDVNIKSGKSSVIQIDGAICKKSITDTTASWLLSGGDSPTSRRPNWEAVEVKTIFSPRYTTGKSKRPYRVRKNDERQMRSKFGEALLEKRKKFTLPRKVHFVYPHGFVFGAVRTVKIDCAYIESWMSDLKKAIANDLVPETAINNCIDLYFLLENASKNRP